MKSPGGRTKGERKSRKGGRSLVLVLTDTSWSNFHFWVVSLFSYLFGLNERKKKLPFLSLLFIPSTNFGYDQCPKSWIGVRKLPEKRQGAPWIELDELHFAREIFLVRKILYWKFKIKKKAHTREGGPNTFSFRGGETSLITSHWARGAPNPPTHSSITVFSWLALIDPYCIGIRRPSFDCCQFISSMFDSTLC